MSNKEELAEKIKATAAKMERKCYVCSGPALMKSRAISIQVDSDELLALLRQQPPEGEFTKKLRSHCRVAYRDCNIDEKGLATVIKNSGLIGVLVRLADGMIAAKVGLEACDRLDEAEADVAQLEIYLNDSREENRRLKEVIKNNVACLMIMKNTKSDEGIRDLPNLAQQLQELNEQALKGEIK